MYRGQVPKGSPQSIQPMQAIQTGKQHQQGESTAKWFDTIDCQMSQHSQITRNMQIGNISVEQIAMSLGSDPDHLVEALEEVFCAPQPTEEQDPLGQESA